MIKKDLTFSRALSLLLSIAITFTCVCSLQPHFSASAAELHNPDGVYLCEAFNIAGGNFYNEPRSQWIRFLDKYSCTDYYIGTPYDEWLYSASPRGDKWQLEEGYTSYITDGGGSEELGGMNSNGFIWHSIAKSLSEGSGFDMTVTGKCVPMLSGFNSGLFSRSCWEGDSNRWSDFISKYNVKYYEFSSKSDMLSSGVLGKGDIIWCVDGSVGTLMAGLSIPADNHHVGIYMGNGSDDLWWQTGPTTGDGDLTAQFNSINPIYGCAKYNTYVVLPWDGVHAGDDTPTVTSSTSVTTPVTTTSAAPNGSCSTRTVTAGLKNPNGQYFNDGIKAASNGELAISAKQWQSFIDSYTSNYYYVDTPYSLWLYATSPRGDKWQYDEGFKEQIISTGGSDDDGGLNCMAFVWHALSLGLAAANDVPIEVAGRYIPFNDEFNTLFSRKAWDGLGGWLSYMSIYDLRYYEFDTKEEMLGSGALRKGDIIWCVDSSFGTGLGGLKTLSDNHHIGIYTGDGSSDQWWQSGPTLGDGILDLQKNSVNPIYGCAKTNSYVVIPFADDTVSPPVVTTAVQTTISTTTEATTTATVTSAETVSTSSDAPNCTVELSPSAEKLILRKGIAPKDIITNASKDGAMIEPEKLSFGSSGEPELEFSRNGDMFSCCVSIYLDNELIAFPVIGTVLKGDADMNGSVNAIDATLVLCYYANNATGKEWHFTSETEAPENMLRECLAYLAADIDTESATLGSEQNSRINSIDATSILTYYAQKSVGANTQW